MPDINTKIINDLIDEHQSTLPKLGRLQKYYDAKHDILSRKLSDPTKTNNKLVNDYPGYVVDTILGYFIGIPVKYTSKNDNFIKSLNDIFELNNEEDHNAELAKYAGILGISYELLYMDNKAQIRFMRLKNEETHIVYDSQKDKSVQMALRYYNLLDTSNSKFIRKVELYSKDKIQYYTYDDKNYRLDEEIEHFFGSVPVIYYENNGDHKGDFEKVLSLIDDYDKRISDNSNEIEEFRNAYLKIKNAAGTTSEDIRKMKELGAILTQGDGDVDWIIKNINDSFSEHHMERLNTNIHKFAKVPDLSDENFAGNLSGVAIKFKLWPIEQVAKNKEWKFKTALKRRIKLITNILNIKGANYNPNDIATKFTRNIPSNDSEASEMVAKLKGTVSNETLLTLLSFIDSPSEEIGKLKKELEDELDYNLNV